MNRINLKSLKRQALAARAGEEFKPGCTGKEVYPTLQAARDEIKSKKTRGLPGRFTSYRCTHCHKFHIAKHQRKGGK